MIRSSSGSPIQHAKLKGAADAPKDRKARNQGGCQEHFCNVIGSTGGPPQTAGAETSRQDEPDGGGGQGHRRMPDQGTAERRQPGRAASVVIPGPPGLDLSAVQGRVVLVKQGIKHALALLAQAD